MGAHGGDAPTGLKQHEARTVFLRAPFTDWAALTQGFKTEFRTLPKGVPSKWLHAPTPVVLYTVSPQLERRSEKLMVLAAHHSEYLSDIKDDPQALMREGFQTYDEFRHYWRARTGRRFIPMEKVEVFRIMPWQPTDRLRLGMLLFDRLYGEYLPDGHVDL